MTTETPKSTPGGLYILSGILFLSVLSILYFSFTTPSYGYQALFWLPLFTYLAVGILTRGPAVRQILMAVIVFLFLLALSNLGATLFSDETQEFSDTGSLIRTIVRLALLPFIFFYLRTEKVKKYFERKSKF